MGEALQVPPGTASPGAASHIQSSSTHAVVLEVDDFTKIAEIGEHPLPPYPIQEPVHTTRRHRCARQQMDASWELPPEEISEQVFIVGGHQSLSRMAWAPALNMNCLRLTLAFCRWKSISARPSTSSTGRCTQECQGRMSSMRHRVR